MPHLTDNKQAATGLLHDITGVILVGGKSRRMGQDKALLELEGKPLIERLLEAFRNCFSDILLVGNNGELFTACNVPVVKDIYPGSALGGLYTGLYHAATSRIFVISCDMVYPNPQVIRRICSIDANGYDAVIPLRSHGYETLCAVYHKSCLPLMKAQLESSNPCILDLYPNLRIRDIATLELDQLDSDGSAFLSVNTPDEFAAVRERRPACQ